MKTCLNDIWKLLILFAVIALLAACKKEEVKQSPTISSSQSAVTDITATTAKFSCEITDDGGATVTARGTCWSTNQSPSISDNKTIDGSGVGSFTSSLTGLTPNTTYFLRAYATNSTGTSYGSQLSFKTIAALPFVTTTPITFIANGFISSGGNISYDGDSFVLQRGVCWSVNQSPTINDYNTSDGVGIGSFTSNIANLYPGTKYYIRAYARNTAGTAYGNELSYLTEPEIPDNVDIYIAGNESNGNVAVAKYWKNGVETTLTDGICNAGATDIAVDGNDIYVTGTESNISGSISTAKYWKNGIPVLLTDGSKSSGATSIAISGGEVYVSGYVSTGPPNYNKIATYWKNGVATALTDGSSSSSANAITIAGNDVYIAGYESGRAKYWKNGIGIPLKDNTGRGSIAGGIAIVEGDVYAAGVIGADAVYWVNDIVVTLIKTDYSEASLSDLLKTDYSSAREILVSDGNIHVVGYKAIDEEVNHAVIYLGKPMYWRNGVAFDLSDVYDTRSTASSIAISGSNIYIVGNDRGQAKYWKNGASYPLTDGTKPSSATAIFLKAK